MRSQVFAALAVCVLTLAGCGIEPIRPIYEYQWLNDVEVPSPEAIRRDFRAYASFICRSGDHQVLDRSFVGAHGPSYVDIRFGCS